MKRNSDQYKKIFKVSNEGILIVDDQFRILEANQSARHLFELHLRKEKHPKIKALIELNRKNDLEHFKRELLELGQAKLKANIAKQIHDFKCIQIHGTARIEANTHLLNIQDITEQELEIRRRERYVAVVGHELKNPVAVIKAYAQLLIKRLHTEINPQHLNYLKKIEKKADILNILVSDLIDEIKTGFDSNNYQDTSFRLDTLIKSIVTDLNKVTNTHEISIVGLDRASISADRTRIMQVITNLINNAIKYSPKASKVLVKLDKRKSEVFISVQDFGRGIAQKEQSSIFKPFYRSKSHPKSNNPSLGLGLYITWNIVKHYHGEIWVESRYQKGSTFFIKLPIA